MNALIEYLYKYFSKQWLSENWKRYIETRGNETPTTFTAVSIIEEISMHPLLYYAADSQDIRANNLDFHRVPKDSGNYSVILLLARDLMILEKELNERGDKIKNSLKRIPEYDSTRFCVLIAAAYKLLGYSVKFLPENDSKTPDLLVTKGDISFVVECKQRNQRESDKRRYEMFIKLVSEVRPVLLQNKLNDLCIEININSNSGDMLERLKTNTLTSIASKNYFWIKNKDFSITFKKAHTRNYFDQFVNNPSNINKVVYFSRTEDAFLFTDPRNQNMVFINKHYTADLLPNNLYDLIEDANKKDKLGKKLVLHYDFGMSDQDWETIVANKVYTEVKDHQKKYENIDLFVFSQTMPKYEEGEVRFKPDFKIIGKKDRLGNISLHDIVGQQGETGMDSYLNDLDRYR